jgi:hypothetical protein
VVAPQASGGGDTRTGIVTIVDMNSLEVQVDVSENYIDRVQVAGPATIHLDAYPDWDVPGSVIAIVPTADQSKGTVEVRVAIKAKDARILPQMAARVSFMTAPEKDRQRLPDRCGRGDRKARRGAGAQDAPGGHHPVGGQRRRPAGERQSRQAA